MDMTEAINGRHSIQAFLSKPVEKEKLDAVLAAAQCSPSWANSQPWEILPPSEVGAVFVLALRIGNPDAILPNGFAGNPGSEKISPSSFHLWGGCSASPTLIFTASFFIFYGLIRCVIIFRNKVA
jgi:hypothetical protein